MKKYTVEDVLEHYDLELGRVVNEVNEAQAKLVLVQFPDGLKMYGTAVIDYLREKTNAEFIVWFGSCFGACDYPVGVDHLKPKIDMIVQFGHSSLMPSY